MRLKLLLAIAITAIAQIANSVIAHAESRQMGNLISVGVASPVENRNLANLVLDRNINTTRNIPIAIDLIAQSKRKLAIPQACGANQGVALAMVLVCAFFRPRSAPSDSIML